MEVLSHSPWTERQKFPPHYVIGPGNAPNNRHVSVHDINWTRRVKNCLSLFRFGESGYIPCETLGEIADLSEAELLMIPNLGRGSVKEIKEVLAQYGLNLKPR